MDKTDWMTVKQAAEYLGVDPETIRRYLNKKRLMGIKNPFTQRWQIERSRLVEFEEKRRNMEGNG
jgi:excisionase family DNA binding protein